MTTDHTRSRGFEKPDDDASDEIASLRDEVAALAARVEDLEEQAAELARKAIALAEEGEEETPRERLERTLAELREKRAAKGQETLVTMLFLAVMVLLAKSD